MCGGRRTTLRDEFSRATVCDQDGTVTGVGKGVSSRPQEEVLRTKGTEGRGTRQRQEIEDGEGRGDGVFGPEGQRTASGKWRFIKVWEKP